MNKLIKVLLFILLTIICITSVCGCAPNNEYVIDARKDNSNLGVDTTDKIVLDPFDGLVVEFDGISPFCTVSFNNSRCSEEVQLNVEYSLSPDVVTTDGYFKIDEDVTVYALLKNQYDDSQEYSLSESSITYNVDDVPQYITEITPDMDLTQFKQEAKDYMESITSFKVGDSIGDWLNSWNDGSYKSSNKPLRNQTYFSAMKVSSYSQYPNEKDYFNRIDITYSIEIMGKYNENNLRRYFTVIAENIVQYPDGTIGWGKDDPATLSFEHNIDWNNMESLINANITSNKADYNVTDISGYME